MSIVSVRTEVRFKNYAKPFQYSYMNMGVVIFGSDFSKEVVGLMGVAIGVGEITACVTYSYFSCKYILHLIPSLNVFLIWQNLSQNLGKNLESFMQALDVLPGMQVVQILVLFTNPKLTNLKSTNACLTFKFAVFFSCFVLKFDKHSVWFEPHLVWVWFTERQKEDTFRQKN